MIHLCLRIRKREKFQCDVCPMSFKTFHNLTGHGRTHNRTKPYECEICGKMISQLSNCKRNYFHTGERIGNRYMYLNVLSVLDSFLRKAI